MTKGGMLVACGLLLMALSASAQSSIRIISQKTLDSLTQVRTLTEGAQMHFEQSEIDLGRLSEDDEPKTVTFVWRNEFETPIVIRKIETGCGCTVAQYDRKPTLPGEQATIQITYHPKGHPGTVLRRCKIYTQKSATTPTAVVTLTGEVRSSSQPTHNYLYVVGPLLFKQRTLHLRKAGGKQTERIACMNGSERTITPQMMPLPKGFTAHIEPKSLQPNEEGDLVISYDPSQAPTTGMNEIRVMFTNLGIAPRETSIRIEMEE